MREFNVKEFDWVSFGCWLGLMVLGGLCVYSASHPPIGGISAIGKSHLINIFLGIVVAAIAYFTPVNRIYDSAYIAWLGACLLLIGVEISGKMGLGAVRWIEIGGLRFQPSEVMKLGVIVALARWLGDRTGETTRMSTILGVSLIAVFPLLMVAAQPDLATSTIYLAPAIAILYWAGYPVSGFLAFGLPVVSLAFGFKPIFLIIVLIIGAIVIRYAGGSIKSIFFSLIAGLTTGFFAPWLWENKLHEYQRNRILTFINPDFDPLGKGYQSIQSKIAIGSGGFTGKGFLNGSQTQLDFLPIQHTDFVFSVLAEEWGFIGALFLLILVGVLFLRLWGRAHRSKNRFAGLLLAGILGVWVYQIFINIAMTVGIMPVAGIPLPFLSYGGTSMLINCMLMGFAINISSHWRSYG